MLQVNAKFAYESKEDLKDNGFSWDKENKVWTKDFATKEEYDAFLEHFMNVSYYGRHAVNKFHSKVVFEVVEMTEESEEIEEVAEEATESSNNNVNEKDMRTNEFYASLISQADNCFIEILTVTQIEKGVFVTFRFGEFDEESAAVIYDDDTIFTPRDWQSPEQPRSVADIDNFDWIEFESKKDAVVVDGLPRLF